MVIVINIMLTKVIIKEKTGKVIKTDPKKYIHIQKVMRPVFIIIAIASQTIHLLTHFGQIMKQLFGITDSVFNFMNQFVIYLHSFILVMLFFLTIYLYHFMRKLSFFEFNINRYFMLSFFFITLLTLSVDAFLDSIDSTFENNIHVVYKKEVFC